MNDKKTTVTTWTLLAFLLPAAALVYLVIWSQTGDPLTAQTEIRRTALALESLAIEEIDLRVRDFVMAVAERPGAASGDGVDPLAFPHVQATGHFFRFETDDSGALEITEPRPPASRTVVPLPGDEQENERYEVFSHDLEEREFIQKDYESAETVLNVMDANFTEPGFRMRTALARAAFLLRRGHLGDTLPVLASLITETDPAAVPDAGELPFVVSAFVLLDRSGWPSDPGFAPVRERFVGSALRGEFPLTPAQLTALAGRLGCLSMEERSRLLHRARSLEIAEAMRASTDLRRVISERETFAVIDGDFLWIGGRTGASAAAVALPAAEALSALLPPETARTEEGLTAFLGPAGGRVAADIMNGASGEESSTAQEIIRTREAPAGIEGTTLTIRLTDRAPFERSAAARRMFVIGAGAFLVAALIGLSFATYRAVRREVAAARARSDFMAAVSHELRTPLASIRTFAELLDEDRVQDAGTRQRFMRLILSNCRRLSAMIENVLDLRRSENGLMRFEIGEVDLGAMLSDLFRDIRAVAEEEGFAVEVDIADDLPIVRADATALARAVFNICDNARKYSGDDKRIAIRAARTDDGALIAISDSGPGIAEAEREAVFERFHRGSGGTGAATGVGLGLSLAREAIEACGGRLDLVSAAGEGATFTIHLPGVEDNDDRAAGNDPDHRG